MIDDDWQKTLDDANPFELAWVLQIIADHLNSLTLSNTATSDDLHDASEACYAAAAAIEPLLTSFTPDQHAFSDTLKYYRTHADHLRQLAALQLGVDNINQFIGEQVEVTA